MQQADCAHSATDAPASPGNIKNHSATRRGMLAAFAALPAVALTTAAAVAVPFPRVASPNRVSPVMAAIAAEIAACERYDELPSDLEWTNPAHHAAEEEKLSAAWDSVVQAEPENWHDLIAQVSHLTEDGEFDLLDRHMPLILRRMRRLAA